MSWWTDARDYVTAPVRSVADFAGDIFGGRSVADSVADLAGDWSANQLGLTSIAYTNTPLVRDVALGLDKYTFGTTGDAYRTLEISKEVNSGRKLDRAGGLEYAQKLGKTGAVIGGGYLGATLLAPALGAQTPLATGLTGFGSSSIAAKLAKGDVKGALESAASNYAPAEIKSAISDVKQTAAPYVQAAQPYAEAAQPYLEQAAPWLFGSPSAGGDVPHLEMMDGLGMGVGDFGYPSTQSGYETGIQKASSIAPLLLIAASVVVIILVKRRKK